MFVVTCLPNRHDCCAFIQIVESANIELENIEGTTFEIVDTYGKLRKFNIRKLIVPTGISLAS